MYLPMVEKVHDENIHGINISIPDNSEEYLAAIYGPNFMIPDKNWTYKRDLYSAKYFSLSEYSGKRIEADDIIKIYAR